MTEHEKDVQRRRKAAKLKEGLIEAIVEPEKGDEDERADKPDKGTDTEG
jgi:hypothetical protein